MDKAQHLTFCVNQREPESTTPIGGAVMTRYHGKQMVRGGVYWNPAGWEIVNVPREGDSRSHRAHGAFAGQHPGRHEDAVPE